MENELLQVFILLAAILFIVGGYLAYRDIERQRRHRDREAVASLNRVFKQSLFDDALIGQRASKEWDSPSPPPECVPCGITGESGAKPFLIQTGWCTRIAPKPSQKMSVWQVYCGKCKTWICELHQPPLRG